LLTANRLIGLVVGPAVVVGLISQQPGLTLNYLFLVGIGVSTYRFSIWYLGVAWEIDRTRDVQARLAVAEERLRFARDLHDSLGRNLTLIAVNTELASELIRREQDGALEHLLQVRRSAQDSMREMRAVVGGYRAVDLQSELAGARSVLRSAGISVRVIGDAAELPEPVQAALGWVVREATTNIIRHSDASMAKIELDVVDDAERGHLAVLRIENDGVHSSRVNASNSEAGADGLARGGADASTGDSSRLTRADGLAGGGSGLIGLRERLSGLGGELIAAPEPGHRFVVLARLPLAAGPRTAEPAQSKSRQSKPAHSEPSHSEPAQPKPAPSKPAPSEPAHSDPAHSKPAHSKPAHSEPAQ
jgi:two-component system sensor histidine kinase DesK